MKLMILCLMVCSIIFSGCATNSQKRWTLMASAAPVGAAVGVATAPKQIKESYHGFYWGAAFVAVAAIIGNYFFSDKKEVAKLKKENEWLKSNPKLELIEEGKGKFKSPFDKDGDEKVYWKVYKTNKWIDAGDGVKFHQDMKIEKFKSKKKE